MLTAYARVVKAVAAGFPMHVAKPVETIELITMIAGARALWISSPTQKASLSEAISSVGRDFCRQNPEEEKTAGKKTDSECRHISYWLDYLRAVAGTDKPLIIVQSQCDTPETRANIPVSLSDWIGSSPWTVESVRQDRLWVGTTQSHSQGRCLVLPP